MLLIAFQISLNPLLPVSDGVCQLYFGQVVRIETLDVTLMGTGHRLLRLDNFEIVRHARAKAVLRLRQCLFRQVNGAAGYFPSPASTVPSHHPRPTLTTTST